VRAGEGPTVLAMFATIFVLLVAYYVLKTVREPLILVAGGATLKSYAAAAQAATLMLYVPLYAWVASKLPRRKLIVAVLLFFIGCLQVFFLAGQAGLPYVGFAFFVWIGIFSLTTIAQFWSFANDIYTRVDGERLFPLIAVGWTAGAPVGAKLAELMFQAGLSPFVMMQIAAGLLLAHLGLFALVLRRPEATTSAPAAGPAAEQALSREGAFGLVLRSRYLLLIGALFILLNGVNAIGEYIIDRSLEERVAAAEIAHPGIDARALYGSFKGNFFFWVNVVGVVLQAFVASRLVGMFGLAGVLLALPLVSLGAYGLIGAGMGFQVQRWAKTAENGTDYSIMNTARQMLWLPTSREEKYKAKQAIDTFFVRTGDLLAAGLVFLGTNTLALSVRGFAWANLAMTVVWLVLAVTLVRMYRAKAEQVEQPAAQSRS
jgi:AAA family ATP:ADP antiporter